MDELRLSLAASCMLVGSRLECMVQMGIQQIEMLLSTLYDMINQLDKKKVASSNIATTNIEITPYDGIFRSTQYMDKVKQQHHWNRCSTKCMQCM